MHWLKPIMNNHLLCFSTNLLFKANNELLEPNVGLVGANNQIIYFYV